MANLDQGVSVLRQFACTYITEDALESFIFENFCDYEVIDGDPDLMDVVPPMKMDRDHLDDRLGDYFVAQGARLIWYAYSMLDTALQGPNERAYAFSYVHYDVAQSIEALCNSGDIYRTRSLLGEVALDIDGRKVVLANDIYELQSVAESKLSSDSFQELQEQANNEYS